MEPDHIHKYQQIDQFLGFGQQGVTLICYKDDCYSEGGPRLDRGLFPPELIGPKLYLSRPKA